MRQNIRDGPDVRLILCVSRKTALDVRVFISFNVVVHYILYDIHNDSK